MPEYLSPAKINLTLDVLDRRSDGYHNLESVAAAIALCDVLSIEPQSGAILITCSRPDLPCDERNLACRAAKSLREGSGLKTGARIHLQKNIPMRAGLGGGSSNAATVLMALNELWGLSWPKERLTEIASRIGSDVPFFLCGKTALLEGRGERITPLSDCPEIPLVLVRPDFGISTAWAYRQLTSRHDRISASFAPGMQEALLSGSLSRVASSLFNVFDEVVCAEYPAIREIHRVLREQGAMGTLLCGSGSAVFGIFPDILFANRAAEALRPHYPFVRVARTLRSVTIDVSISNLIK